MAETRTDRTEFMGLLALMNQVAATQGWGYPYWNMVRLDAVIAALHDALRDGTAQPVAPVLAPDAQVAGGGQLPATQALEVVQTFVDRYGRETAPGPAAEVEAEEGVANPLTPPELGTPTQEATGFEGGAFVAAYTWTDGAGGETLASDAATTTLPYLPGGLYSQLTLTLPSTPAAVGAAGANIYIQHRGGNVVLAKRITDADQDEVLLDGTIADCWRTAPFVNSMGSNRALEITGDTAPEGAEKTRFYVRPEGATWADADRRIAVGGLDEWDVDEVSYPLLYTGATGTLVPGYPPTISQVQAIRPVDLETETIGELSWEQLPVEVVLETELVRSLGEAILAGFAVTAHAPADMGVHVAVGEVLMSAGRFIHEQSTDLIIPTADLVEDRIDIVCIADDGAIEGPTENAALKGTPGPTPGPPATPVGYLKIAEIYVTASDTEITSGDIIDSRLLMTTLVTETAARIAEDQSIAEDLQDHEADA
ncbi:MAG: hypothetical protein JW990_12020, partial [Thermoleophilia bacterium]|nr:hypothetical protein [Thermoleophilia bacterium]